MKDRQYPLLRFKAPALGLIVLRVDETIEEEFRTFIPSDAARLYVTRIASGDDLDADSISEMGKNLTGAAALLPTAANFDVVAYACTSGTALLGSDRVHQLVSKGISTRAVTDPLTAAVAQVHHLGLERIGIVSPYVKEIADTLAASFEARGVTVAASLCFDESSEAAVARIDPRETVAAARELADRAVLDGVFLSCTNLKTANILSSLAQDIGKPVLSSNQSLAWHMKRLAFIT